MGNCKLGVLKATGDTATWKQFVIKYPQDVNPELPKAVELLRRGRALQQQEHDSVLLSRIMEEQDSILFPKFVQFSWLKARETLIPCTETVLRHVTQRF